MRLPRLIILGSCLALLASGCKSSGPHFDAHQTPPGSDTGEPGESHAHKLFKLDEKAFTLVQSTNLVLPEWLKPPTRFFTLGPGDVVDIEAAGETNSRSSLLVGPDGKVYYGLLPGVSVWGLTLSEAKDRLEKEHTNYVRVMPDLNLNLRTVGSQRLWILGNVQSPGVYSLAAPMTVLEAIATAGGTVVTPGSAVETTDLQNSFVMRRGQAIRVDFERLLRKGDLSQNIYLQPDDFLYLRPAVARSIYVLGAVMAPNALPASGQPSLVSAITSAGGPAEYAYLTHVAVVRGSLANPRIAVIDYKAIIKGKAPDVRLEPGDIVYVPLAPYRFLGQFLDQALHNFVNVIALNEGYRAVSTSGAPIALTPGIGAPASAPIR
jgi:polysaccharide export outer membrane protein